MVDSTVARLTMLLVGYLWWLISATGETAMKSLIGVFSEFGTNLGFLPIMQLTTQSGANYLLVDN